MRKYLVLGLCLALAVRVLAVERKTIRTVNTDELTGETQVSAECADDHMNFVWWVPVEFWEATFAQSDTSAFEESNEMIETLRAYSILAVCQADISAFGSFDFYPESEIARSLKVSYRKGDAEPGTVEFVEELDPGVELLLSLFKPILTAAMGELGKNFHFFVLDDRDRKGERVLDPYSAGTLIFEYADREGDRLTADIELPLNALFVPRKCSNGKDAHISWKYCPWTGEKLED